MTITIECTNCKQELTCDRSLIGTKGLCKRCGNIVLISTNPLERVLVEKAAKTKYVFVCPSCQQLFEGSRDMNGRSGKCSGCGNVFEIRIRKAKKPKALPRPEAQTNLETQSQAVEFPRTSQLSSNPDVERRVVSAREEEVMPEVVEAEPIPDVATKRLRAAAVVVRCPSGRN